MPTYDYACDKCGHAFEKFQTMTDSLLKECPKCGSKKVHRLIGSGSGIIFKGTGFYENDYKKKSKPGDSCSGPKGGGCKDCPQNSPRPSK